MLARRALVRRLRNEWWWYLDYCCVECFAILRAKAGDLGIGHSSEFSEVMGVGAVDHAAAYASSSARHTRATGAY
jgi:hypothetical protein